MKTKGRPKKETRRDLVFTIRMNQQEMKDLIFMSEKTGLPMVEVVREALKMKLNLVKFQ